MKQQRIDLRNGATGSRPEALRTMSRQSRSRPGAPFGAGYVASAWLAAALLLVPVAGQAQPAKLPTLSVAGASQAQGHAFEASVEAVRQTVIAAQVAGAIVQVQVRAGEHVRAGQLLMRLDARAAEQQAGASAAQVLAARAALDAARSEFERQQQLFKKQYISQAALERAEAQFKTAAAQAEAQVAAAGAARTETSFFQIRAPYDGIVSELHVVQGDMAMPGRALLTLYDPSRLRVTAAIPESLAATLKPAQGAAVAPAYEVPAAGIARQTATQWELLPAADAATHTLTLRAELPAGSKAYPGMAAQLWLQGLSRSDGRVLVPNRAIVRRAELTAVYVLSAQGKPLLRQVRLGPQQGEQVEVLAGLKAGEQLVLDPQAAAKVQ